VIGDIDDKIVKEININAVNLTKNEKKIDN
jgi:hypothetical protein